MRIQGVIPPPVPLDQALSFLENEARTILPQGFTIDYAGESRQLRTEGSRFLGDVPAVGDPDLPGARGAVRELPRSVHHPGGLGAAGASPARCCSRSSGFTTLNIYSQVGLITLVGLVSKNGILIVQFANHLQETGLDKLHAVIEAAGTRLRPILMTTAATVVGHLPLVLATGPGRRRAQQHRHHAGDRHDHRHDVHAVRGAVDLRAAWRASTWRFPTESA